MENVDVLIIGGGVNGAGIARDAAGRGLSVMLCEKDDLGGATSSSSTKLFHGGLRYLEFFEFKLVREALLEREHLLQAMPHISWPLRFVLPVDDAMIHPNVNSGTSKVLRWTMPWLRGRRPAWVMRMGLFLYDALASNSSLPRTRRLDLSSGIEGAAIKDDYAVGLEYSDGWVDDARLVILNCRDAQARGAVVRPRTKVEKASPNDNGWEVTLSNGDSVQAKVLVNAGGPWVSEVLAHSLGQNKPKKMRLVRGSHIITKKLYDHDKAYFLQQPDGRIIFTIPYEQDFTLIGTTEADHDGDPKSAECSDVERDYLVGAVNQYFAKPISADDVVWTYSGVRPLVEEEDASATATSRDYELEFASDLGAPVLNIYGGKITTYRHLSEEAVNLLGLHFQIAKGPWTRGVALPGGDFGGRSAAAVQADLQKDYPFLDARWALRLVRLYGVEAWDVLGDATSVGDLGRDFGATLYQREVDWMRSNEWAVEAEDILWRRSKLGLHGAKLS